MSKHTPIYLDYNATTPIHPGVAQAMLPYLHDHFGNPSSGHWFGRQARTAVEQARRQVADLLRCRPEEIIFTSGGSESNNLAIKGVAEALRHKGRHIITSQIEHPAVSEVCRYLGKQGFEITEVPVDSLGRIRMNELDAAVRPDTILITVMHANNEVGAIQPIAEISEIARKRGIVLHTDAAQSAGKIPVHVSRLGVDLLTIAGHKLYAPKGVGALYIRSGTPIEKQIHGANHERGLRAGTENVLEIVGLGAACQLAREEESHRTEHLSALRDQLQERLLVRFPGAQVNGHPREGLPNTLSISIPGVNAGEIVSQLGDRVALSAGAACHADQVHISATLQAMGVPPEQARGTFRFSVGSFTTPEEIRRAVDLFAAAVSDN